MTPASPASVPIRNAERPVTTPGNGRLALFGYPQAPVALLRVTGQRPPLWPHLTVLGNVAYALRRRKLDSRAAAGRAHDALSRVGLSALAARYPHELSGGEQQRVGLARAIVADPAVLLFDEPLSNLDADLRERLRVEIATVTRDTGGTALYITHDQSEAFALADRIGVLNAGQLVQFGPPEEICHRPRIPFVAQVHRRLRDTARRRGRTPRGKHVLVRFGAHQPACRAAGPLRDGDGVSLLIRGRAFASNIEVSTPPCPQLASGHSRIRG